MRADSIKKYLKEHKVMGRWTTFNGALQSALAVPEDYDPAKHREALGILGQSSDEDLICIYCGKPAATWDHLHNNVKGRRFSGFGNRVFNLVPACRTCNEKKGGKHWHEYLSEIDVPNKEGRAKLIAQFEAKNSSERFGWDRIVAECPDMAEKYAGIIEEVRQKLQEADALASQIRNRVRESIVRAGQGLPKDVVQTSDP